MSAFSIHPQPAKVIERAAAVLETLIDLDEVSLGGGTALEAHWHHRTSTDLDFFATGARIDTLFYEFEQLNDVITAHWKAGRIDGKRPSVTKRTVLHFEIDGTPVSIGRVSEMHGSGEDTEILTGIKLSHNKDILTKKLFNRLFENQVVTERDAYDFGVARTFDAQSLEYAWSHIGKHARAC
ncbi:MAG: hypothetical protein OXF72_06980 [Gammaproteobacteria bacterium]|nr:hypothetical protein [Gammaproteobacteria bacterium]MCY4322769.1 hypothetical protein [Gammaproteobacteria bacterium]